MSDLITVQAVVLSVMPMGEYDKRLVLLTRERGKISVFAKGARRPNSPFLAAANPFVFGSFTLYEGRTSYNLNHAAVTNYFVELAAMQPGVYYGFYFLELADYFGREGIDEKDMMNLLYVSFKALLRPELDHRLVRCIFEFRTMVIQGEYPQIFQCVSCSGEKKELSFFSQRQHGVLCASCAMGVPDSVRISPAALYALQYMASAPLQKLYGFTVKPEILEELERIIHTYVAGNTDKKFKSLGILEVMS